jgi:hypothetical protein
VEKVIFRPDVIEAAKAIVCRIHDNLKAVKSHQETYVNKRRRPLEFKVGNHVNLRVSPMKGMKRFRVKGKLTPRYIGPFHILEKCGTMAYKLDLPPSLARVHDIFHFSQLKKCLKAPVDVVLPEVTPLKAAYRTPSTQSKYWIRRIMSRGIKPPSSSRYNGATTLKKKQLGKARTLFILTIRTLFCHREKCVIVCCSC